MVGLWTHVSRRQSNDGGSILIIVETVHDGFKRRESSVWRTGQIISAIWCPQQCCYEISNSVEEELEEILNMLMDGQDWLPGQWSWLEILIFQHHLWRNHKSIQDLLAQVGLKHQIRINIEELIKFYPEKVLKKVPQILQKGQWQKMSQKWLQSSSLTGCNSELSMLNHAFRRFC